MTRGILKRRLPSVTKWIVLTVVYGVVFLVASIDLRYAKSKTVQRGQEESQALGLVNLTEHLETQVLSRDGGKLQLSIKNKGAKTAVAWAVKDTGSYTVYDFIGSEKDVIRPGETKVLPYVIPEAKSGGTSSPSVTLAAVVFEGGDSEGDPEIIEEIRQTRLGMKVQVAALVKILRRLLIAPSGQLSSALEQAAIEAKGLSDIAKEGGFSRKIGLSNGKNNDIYVIDELRSILQRDGEERCRQIVAAKEERYSNHLVLLKSVK